MTKIILRTLRISIGILLGILVVCGLYRIGIGCYEFGYRVYTEPAVSETDDTPVLVQITDTTDAKDLAKLLEEKHLIRDDRLFYLQEKLYGYSPVAGIYKVSATMTPAELMAAMTPEETSEEQS